MPTKSVAESNFLRSRQQAPQYISAGDICRAALEASNILGLACKATEEVQEETWGHDKFAAFRKCTVQCKDCSDKRLQCDCARMLSGENLKPWLRKKINILQVLDVSNCNLHLYTRLDAASTFNNVRMQASQRHTDDCKAQSLLGPRHFAGNMTGTSLNHRWTWELSCKL